jgi:hypothetical protein
MQVFLTEAHHSCCVNVNHVGQYYIVKYKGSNYVGKITNVEKDEAEVPVLTYPEANKFCWPSKKDKSWYDHVNIIQMLPAPIESQTKIGRKTVISLAN